MDKASDRGASDRGGETDRLEEALAHLARTVDDLSGIVARQDREIARLTSRVEALMRAEAERIADAGTVPLASQRPPHW